MREFLACRGDGRDGEKTILEFVGSNAQTIEVNEGAGRNLSIHLGGVC
ncbi:hypothetical protein [Bradyrhizobium sp. sBnM-33]|nr:hypothetical protein [Bradyrhizobium sp. sBnM-33]WOH52168.1 hypothetical protein RX328_07915 [Bradyrhizobium sp. sBnM-33]